MSDVLLHHSLAASRIFDESMVNSITADTAPYDELHIDMHASARRVSVSPGASEESAATDVPTASKFGDIERKYRVDSRVIGRGHHGAVRACIERATDRPYAVKTVRKSDPHVIPVDLAREIAVLRQMDDPGIVRLVDAFEDKEHVHLVTDLCTGGELFDRILERSSKCDNGAACFSEDEAARIVYQILKALSYMHSIGVAHRDIKVSFSE